jgi:hypothetical protein
MENYNVDSQSIWTPSEVEIPRTDVTGKGGRPETRESITLTLVSERSARSCSLTAYTHIDFHRTESTECIDVVSGLPYRNSSKLVEHHHEQLRHDSPFTGR